MQNKIIKMEIKSKKHLILMKILNFWNISVDSKVHEYLFNPLAKVTKPVGESISLQDLKYRKAPTAKTEGALL